MAAMLYRPQCVKQNVSYHMVLTDFNNLDYPSVGKKQTSYMYTIAQKRSAPTALGKMQFWIRQ